MKTETQTAEAMEVPTAPENLADKTQASNSARMWRGRIERCKSVRNDLVRAWAENVDFRRGKPFQQESDDDRVNVNLDWSLTKGKHAQLFSQTPRVYLTPKSQAFKDAVPVFQQQLNDRLQKADVGSAVDESVLDAINASGVGAVMVGYQAKTMMQKMPKMEEHKRALADLTPEQQEQAFSSGLVPFEEVPKILDVRFSTDRLSPSDLLWPTEFTGSNFDNAPWIGRSGTMLWDEAVIEFDLKEEQKQDVCGGRSGIENLRQETSGDNDEDQVVEFDEVFYWAYKFDAKENYFKKIRRIVFVRGVAEPVKNEDWAGQEFNEQSGTYIGSCKFPVRVLTLTYLSDDCIPPSDSAIGRPQILEIIKSRSLQIMQRERSMPVRWYDVNRTDPLVHESLMRGTYQAFIPVSGDGSRVIGEVARANTPPDNYEHDRVVKFDLQEQWQVGSNQLGTFASGERSASEANIVQQNFQTRIGYERARVSAFFTGIAEVMAGLIALYDTFPLTDPQSMQRLEQGWDRRTIGGEFVYYIRPDSTVLLDANQRVDKLLKLLNLVGKSGFINPKPIIEEIVALHDVDPMTVMVDPQTDTKQPPSIGYSFKGEDLINPVVVAILMEAGMAPTPESLQAANKLLQAAGIQPPDPNEPIPPAGPEMGGGEPPMLPEGAPSADMADARPDWTPMPRVTKRLDEPGG